MSTQHYAAFIKLDKQDVVEVSTRDLKLQMIFTNFLVQENAKIPSGVLSRLKSRLNRHAQLERYVEGKTTKQQTQQNDRQTAQVPYVSSFESYQK